MIDEASKAVDRAELTRLETLACRCLLKPTAKSPGRLQRYIAQYIDACRTPLMKDWRAMAHTDLAAVMADSISKAT